jgi:hypothetical protein
VNRLKRLETAAVRYGFPAALGLAALLSTAQMWVHIHRLMMSECKFPDVCWDSVYPEAFSALTRLWFVSIVVAWILLGWSSMRRDERATLLRIGGAGVAVFLSFFLTPLSGGRNANGWLNNGRPVSLDASYAAGLLLLFLAALLFTWELLARSILQPSRRGPATAEDPGVRGNAPSVPVLLVSLLSFTAALYAIMWATTYGWFATVMLGVALGTLVPRMRLRSTQGLLVGITAGSAVVAIILGTLTLAT